MLKAHPRREGFTLRVNGSRGPGRLVVTADGTGVEGRTGTVLLSRTADRVGLTGALRQAVDGCRNWRDHPPGRVVGDLAVMLADGGRCTDDIETLRRRHTAVFGHVASQPTAWRTIEALAADELVDIRLFDALGRARTQAWAAGAAPPGWDDQTVPATIDIDATLVTAHSEKDRTAGTYKGGYGFHPLLAWLDRGDGHGEPLGALLRPGNAGANDAGDNIDVLEQALANLPAMPAGKQVIVRGDSAMATKDFCSYARQAGAAVSVSLRSAVNPASKQQSAPCTPISLTSGSRSPPGRHRARGRPCRRTGLSAAGRRLARRAAGDRAARTVASRCPADP